MAELGTSAQSQLDRHRKARETSEAAKQSLELSRLQRENEQLRGENIQLHQQSRDAAINAARQAVDATYARIQEQQQAAGQAAGQQAAQPAAAAETPRQKELRERFQAGKASAAEALELGVSQSQAARPQQQPLPAPVPAAQSQVQQPGGAGAQPILAKDWRQLSPVEQIGLGLAQSKPARG